MIEAKSWDALAEFQKMHFTKRFKWWHDCMANCIKAQEEL
jgi:hypothetical protein